MTNLIQEIYIKNFAIIEEVQCTFEKGMTVLTGETGAGKSIIIDAVGLLIGERASLEMIRYGEEKSLIQGVFRIEDPSVVEKLQEFGVEVVEDELMIQRELLQNGKSNCRINGQLATVALLKQIGFTVEKVTYSPITGGSGNIEFLAHLKNTAPSEVHSFEELARETVKEAQRLKK